MEKGPNKNSNSLIPVNSEWDEIAELEKQKDIDQIRAIEDKSDISPFLKEQIRYERAIGKAEPTIIEVPESEIRMAAEPEKEAEKDQEIEQAKELELAQARELKLAEAKELDVAQASKELLELDNEKDITDYEDTVKELLELENAEDIAEYEDVNAELLKLEEQIAKEEKNPNSPLVAINADWSHDKTEIAHDLAEQALNAETSDGNVIKRLWKGTLFKKYYEKKYEKEFLAGKRTNEEGKTVLDIIKEEAPDVMERFVMSAIEKEDAYIHGLAGEKLEKVDEKTNEAIKHAIEKYARTSVEKGMKVSDLDRAFRNDINRIVAEARDEGRLEKGFKGNNFLNVAKKAARRYEEVAVNAKTKAEHDKALAEVMAGFQAYNAEVRNTARTEAHRDNIDKIVNALESSKIGQFIPAEIIAGAAGAAVALTQTGVRAVFGAAGGIIASSAISGLKERNRITEDRARMLRDVASGKDYNSKNKKVAKHEQRIGGTLYDMEKASDLTARIEAAMNPEDGNIDRKALLSAIAEARVRIDFSDAERKDLISYSSDKNRGKERLELDVAVIRAEKALGKKDRKTLEIMKEHVEESLYEDVSARDKKFKRYRTAAAMKKAGKTLALGSAIFLGSQEIMAAVDPDKIGIFEKAGLIKTENSQDAKETLLASGFGQFRGSYEVTGPSTKEQIDNVSSPSDIKKYEEAGFAKIKTQDAWTETESNLAGVDPSASTARVDIKYDGWANNGTRIADGNEVRGYLENGKFISNLRGSSTFNGRTINYDPSNVKAYITVGDSKFEIAGTLNESGQLTWGDNGIFTTTTGETIKAIGDNGEKLYKYFEIAADSGVDADGVQHIIPLATDVGTNAFSGKIEQVVETVVEHPAVYSFVKNIPGNTETFVRGITTNGFAFGPETARTGLGEATQTMPVRNIEVMPDREVEVPPEILAEIGVPTEPEPAPAPESAPEALEATPAEATLESPVNFSAPESAPAPESDSTPESDFENWENDMREDIESVRDEIGDEGIAAFMDSTPLNSAQQKRWREWWNTLDEDRKAAIRNLNDHIVNSNLNYAYDANRKFGVPFQTWLALNS